LEETLGSVPDPLMMTLYAISAKGGRLVIVVLDNVALDGLSIVVAQKNRPRLMSMAK